MVFYANVNGTIIFISFSDSSLLVYRNASDFGIFISYPKTLLNFSISYLWSLQNFLHL